MTRSKAEVEQALENLDDGTWKYNDDRPVSERVRREGAATFLQEVLDDDIDVEVVKQALNGDLDLDNLDSIARIGYIDAVLWYTERETLMERMQDEEPVLVDPMGVE